MKSCDIASVPIDLTKQYQERNGFSPSGEKKTKGKVLQDHKLNTKYRNLWT